jgi:hypothetical protein
MYYGIGNTGIPNPSSIEVELTEKGTILIHSGVCEIGQGSDTVLMQIALETLEIDSSFVEFSAKDTSITFDAGSTSASRQTYISGKALYNACLQMKKFLRENGFYSGENTLKEIFDKKGNVQFKGCFDPPTSGLDPETSQGIPYASYAFATHLSWLEVDKDTGSTTVKKVWAAHDVGKAVNPLLLRGQVNSGVAMGIGMAIMEKFENGKTVNMEKALTLNSPLDGHIVQGHVDEAGKVKSLIRRDIAWQIEIEVSKESEPFLIPSGSISVNGVSLTIANSKRNTFTLVIIPHSFKETNLSDLKVGDMVNIEYDFIAKYLYHFKKFPSFRG